MLANYKKSVLSKAKGFIICLVKFSDFILYVNIDYDTRHRSGCCGLTSDLSC